MSESSPESLFINLYFDEDVSALVARLIRARQFHTLTALEAERTGKSDAEQLVFAVEHSMTILTHNRKDFEALARQYVALGHHHSGILIAVRRPPYELARRVLGVLNRFTADEMVDQLLYV